MLFLRRFCLHASALMPTVSDADICLPSQRAEQLRSSAEKLWRGKACIEMCVCVAGPPDAACQPSLLPAPAGVAALEAVCQPSTPSAPKFDIGDEVKVLTVRGRLQSV